ncbi:MAG TPA: DUF1564 family protein [Leptospiraceae bacterium]|nr:DUF1564 family protein [Leptospiraceae bacterium]
MEDIDIQLYQEEIQKNISHSGSGVSTVLIPEDLMLRYETQEQKFGGKTQYFSHLISKYRMMLRSFAHDESSMTTEYQKSSHKLKKVNFRPIAEDWAELGAFSIASGKSRCLLFVLLLLMDLNGWGDLLSLAGFPYDYPNTPNIQWELLGIFGVERAVSKFIRGLMSRLIRMENN